MNPHRTSLTLIVLVIACACAGTKYGSHDYDVVLDTVPTHCRAWIVPNTQWVNDQTKLLEPNSPLREKCETGVTPWPISKPPYHYVFIAMDSQQHIAWKEFKPSRDTTVTLQFDQPVPQTPAEAKSDGPTR